MNNPRTDSYQDILFKFSDFNQDLLEPFNANATIETISQNQNMQIKYLEEMLSLLIQLLINIMFKFRNLSERTLLNNFNLLNFKPLVDQTLLLNKMQVFAYKKVSNTFGTVFFLPNTQTKHQIFLAKLYVINSWMNNLLLFMNNLSPITQVTILKLVFTTICKILLLHLPLSGSLMLLLNLLVILAVS